jgi:hypothetical protein
VIDRCVWHNDDVRDRRGLSGASNLVAALLGAAGIASITAAFGPWVVTHTRSGGVEHITGVRLESLGWWVAGFGLILLAASAAARRWTVTSGLFAIPVGVLLWAWAHQVDADISDVRGYVRVEGSAAGISNSITHAAHLSGIDALRRGWGGTLLLAAAGLALAAAGIAVVVSASRFGRGKVLVLPD